MYQFHPIQSKSTITKSISKLNWKSHNFQSCHGSFKFHTRKNPKRFFWPITLFPRKTLWKEKKSKGVNARNSHTRIDEYTKKKTHKVGQLQNFLVMNNNNELMIFQNKKKKKTQKINKGKSVMPQKLILTEKMKTKSKWKTTAPGGNSVKLSVKPNTRVSFSLTFLP